MSMIFKDQGLQVKLMICNMVATPGTLVCIAISPWTTLLRLIFSWSWDLDNRYPPFKEILMRPPGKMPQRTGQCTSCFIKTVVKYCATTINVEERNSLFKRAISFAAMSPRWNCLENSYFICSLRLYLPFAFIGYCQATVTYHSVKASLRSLAFPAR